jgi:hypothetical protein
MPIEEPPPGKAVNRWREYKQAGKIGMAGAGVGIQVAQLATGTGTMALVAAGAAASATGIGLVVTGAVLTLATAGCSAVSAHKSRLHRNGLQAIYERRNAYVCGPVDKADPKGMNHFEHKSISEDVLPYLVEQKNKKYHRKVVGAVPGLGLAETLRAVGKKAYKAASGTLGVERNRSARWLAKHLITHDCAMTQAIVAELFSFEEMVWIKDQEFDDVVKLIEGKMKST